MPGELLSQGELSKGPSRQREEHFYYLRCSLCDLHIGLIKLNGCDQCKDPSPEAVSGSREAQSDRVEAARELEAAENLAIGSSAQIIAVTGAPSFAGDDD